MGDVRYARNGDVNLAYRVIGDGPVDIMFVNIWYSNLDLLDLNDEIKSWLDGLAGFTRMVVWDRRGAGISDRLPGPATLEEGMDDLIAVLDDAGMEKVALFGFNESSTLCALMAASHPERVSSLILYGAFATTTYQDDYPWGQRLEERRQEAEMIMENWGSRQVAQMAMISAEDRVIDWAMRWMRTAVSRDALPAFYEMLEKTDVRHVLPTIQVPTLVMHRTNDRAIPVENGRYIASKIPGARFVEFEGEVHVPFLGDHQVIEDEIEEFLTGARRERDEDRVLATILFTDIVDSTAAAASMGDARWRQLLDEHDRVAKAEIARLKGRLIKSTGDGLLATFDGPQRAIRCARSLRTAMERLGLKIRIGLHTGEIELRGEDVGGIAVHIGARVMALAEPGEVLTSGAIPPLVAGSGISFEARGVHQLKGVDGEWPVFAVSA